MLVLTPTLVITPTLVAVTIHTARRAHAPYLSPPRTHAACGSAPQGRHAARYLVITPVQDTLNESGYVSDSLAAIKGRTIHTYHSEGAGGGHAPDIIKARYIAA